MRASPASPCDDVGRLTPAMAAGITDRLWSFDDLIASLGRRGLTACLPVHNHLAAAGLLAAQDQAVLTVQPINDIPPDLSALTLQHDMHKPIAMADPRRNDVMHPLPDRGPRIPRAQLALRRSMLPEHRSTLRSDTASPPRACSISPSQRMAHKSTRAASCSIGLSSVRSEIAASARVFLLRILQRSRVVSLRPPHFPAAPRSRATRGRPALASTIRTFAFPTR